MKFSEQWLREWVDPPISTDELAEQLTMAGLEVEGVESCGPDFSGVIVSRVEQVDRHPDADNLSLCRVDAGAGSKLTVVCGAHNIRTGNLYPLAQDGATLPGNSTIQTTAIKGVKSEGMLCSGAELGLTEEADCLLELDPDALTGTDLQQLLALDDQVIELSLTPNRGDCLSITGIAREVGVLNRIAVTKPVIEPIAAVSDHTREVKLAAPEACPCYIGRIIDDININRVSPAWLTEKLRRSGLRSINIVVDITNYVMLELGQPMHAFDNDLLDGAISARYATAGEQMILLDGQTCDLMEQTLVIADATRAVALAGIMGGMETAISGNTGSLFLESAFFTSAAVVGRARQYGLRTDASHRYERGVDYRLQQIAMERATGLILEYCGGKAGPVIAGRKEAHLPERRPVALRSQRLNDLLGVEINRPRVTETLQRLELETTEVATGWQVTAPSFRFDITREIDLVEEIARVYGYDKLPGTGLKSDLRIHSTVTGNGLDKLRQVLVTRGYHEAITYSFVDAKLQEILFNADHAIALLNPISSDLGVMRQSLWPGLLQALQYNLKRRQQRVRLFECGRIFNQGAELTQESVIAGIISGNMYEEQWGIDDNSCDLFDIKGDMESLLHTANRELKIEYHEKKHAALHPGQTAEVIVDNQVFGLIGAVHPGILRRMDIDQSAYVFELYLSRISQKKALKFTKLSKFPSVRRDISVLMDRDIPVAKVLNCIKLSVPELLVNLQLFDVYQGESIDLEKKSLALGLTFQGTSSTLTDEEVEKMVLGIINTLNSEFGATLRE